MARYKPEVWFNISDVIGNMQVHDVSIAYDDKVYVLASTKHISRYSGGTPLIRTEEPVDYTVLVIENNKKLSSYRIPAQTLIYSYLQPLPNDELLLVCGRSRFRKPSDYDLNGQVFSKEGFLQREFLLGDGISHLQTTHQGMIWTGYFDEGVVGNFGWGGSGQNPIGESGLVKWNSSGQKLWEFDAVELNIPAIVDCYAMNVVDDKTVWVYYYSDFRIVRFVDHKLKQSWRSPISGIQLLSVWQNYIMFYSRYRFTLYQFTPQVPMKKISDHKVSPRPERIDIRGDTFVYLNDMRLYRTTIGDMMNA